MARYPCTAILIAGLISGCATPPAIPEPVVLEKECPTLADQIDPSLYAPVRELGKSEVFARGGLNRHLWLVMLEQSEELKYCNMRFEMLRTEILKTPNNKEKDQ